MIWMRNFNFSLETYRSVLPWDYHSPHVRHMVQFLRFIKIDFSKSLRKTMLGWSWGHSEEQNTVWRAQHNNWCSIWGKKDSCCPADVLGWSPWWTAVPHWIRRKHLKLYSFVDDMENEKIFKTGWIWLL